MLEHAKQSVTEQLKLPGDVMLGEILLSFSGRHSVTVENYRKYCCLKRIVSGFRAKTADCRSVGAG